MTAGRIVFLLQNWLLPEGTIDHAARVLKASSPVVLMGLLWRPGTYRTLGVVGHAARFAVGFQMGPVYPFAMMQQTQSMDAQEQMGWIGIVSAAGSYGAAVVPFIAMILTNTLWALLPVVGVLHLTMHVTWYPLLDRL